MPSKSSGKKVSAVFPAFIRRCQGYKAAVPKVGGAGQTKFIKLQ